MDSQSQKKTRIQVIAAHVIAYVRLISDSLLCFQQAPELRSVKFSQSDSQGVATGPSQASEQSALASDGISSSSLAELCDSRYLHGKGKLGKKLTGPTSDSGNRRNASKPAEIKQQSSFAALGSQSSQATQPAKSGLRVEMIDGKMVIKESSLIVNDAAINETEYEEVEEGALVNSRYSSFTNRRPAKAWGLEETRLFYNVLRQCGLEFSLMQSFFPNRTRKEIKLKFRR